MPHDSSCIHYQLTGGSALQVEKGEPYDYCTNDLDAEDAYQDEADYWDYEA